MKHYILQLLLIFPVLVFAQDTSDPCYSINDVFSEMELTNPILSRNIDEGWNMIGYPCNASIDAIEAFETIVEKILIVKNNNGDVYMPEFGFNGIGNLSKMKGYQIKLTEQVTDFSFCSSIDYPEILGCTDCEALNYNPWTTIDDGSCNYDTDGDGVYDADEIVGCLEELACNFNNVEDATDNGGCEFPEEGYNCYGNEIIASIGDTAFGGIVFYIDSTGQNGLVASLEDTEDRYKWGCYDVDVDGADGFIIGSGLQNTIDIVNSNCLLIDFDYNLETEQYEYSEPYEGLTAADICYDYENNGYSDWYLPSIDELELLFDNISLSLYIYYWSSTELAYSTQKSKALFTPTGQILDILKFSQWKVRPIRSFGNMNIEGCLDENACNYDFTANYQENIICEYPEEGYDCEGNFNVQIGDEAFGGIVFYIDETGEKGLVAALEDLEGTYQWGCYGSNISGADEQAIGFGLQNTNDIVAGCPEALSAANMALDYVSNDFDDWYLPSRNELAEMFGTISFGGSNGNIGGFTDVYPTRYWSSTENDNVKSHIWDMFDGGTYFFYKNHSYNVRPIRAFGNWTIGCTDSLACNFNPQADMVDGNCEYPVQGYDCEGNIIVQIGDEAYGGIVFYLDETGEHGLVVNVSDIGSNQWGCLNENIEGADGLSIGTGLSNSIAISSQCTTSNAANECLSYESDEFEDWFLPSLNELIELNNVIETVPGLPVNTNLSSGSYIFYWSSSESGINGSAMGFNINTGYGVAHNRSDGGRLRPIRAF